MLWIITVFYATLMKFKFYNEFFFNRDIFHIFIVEYIFDSILVVHTQIQVGTYKYIQVAIYYLLITAAFRNLIYNM